MHSHLSLLIASVALVLVANGVMGSDRPGKAGVAIDTPLGAFTPDTWVQKAFAVSSEIDKIRDMLLNKNFDDALVAYHKNEYLRVTEPPWTASHHYTHDPSMRQRQSITRHLCAAVHPSLILSELVSASGNGHWQGPVEREQGRAAGRSSFRALLRALRLRRVQRRLPSQQGAPFFAAELQNIDRMPPCTDYLLQALNGSLMCTPQAFAEENPSSKIQMVEKTLIDAIPVQGILSYAYQGKEGNAAYWDKAAALYIGRADRCGASRATPQPGPRLLSCF